MSLLPPNASELERAIELLTADRIDGIESPLRAIWSPTECPAALLPWLAWALSIDNWDPNWPERVRRARIEAALAVQRRKGTASSVRELVASMGGTIGLREWFQMDPPGDPHTFELQVALPGDGGAAPSAAFIDSVIAEVRAAKPLRSHFTFTTAQNATAAIGLRAVGRPAVLACLSLQSPPGAPDAPNVLTMGSQALTLGGEALTLGT